MPAPHIPRTIARNKPKSNLHSRVAHLAFVRLLPCVACGKAAPSEAAYVRTGTDGGVGVKPGDRYAVPLCRACHTKQYRIGELTFWSALRIDPLNVTLQLWMCQPIWRPGSARCFARHSKSTWRRHLAEQRIPHLQTDPCVPTELGSPQDRSAWVVAAALRRIVGLDMDSEGSRSRIQDDLVQHSDLISRGIPA